MTSTALYALLTMLGILNAAEPASKIYQGAWFDISFPANFSVVPGQKSSTSSRGYDSACFVSPDKSVEFYVYSPQWSGNSKWMDIDPRREYLDKTKTSHSNKTGLVNASITDIWMSISAIDRSYTRFVHYHGRITENGVEATDFVVGIKCPDMKSYDRYKGDYEKFRKSLIQYSD